MRGNTSCRQCTRIPVSPQPSPPPDPTGSRPQYWVDSSARYQRQPHTPTAHPKPSSLVSVSQADMPMAASAHARASATRLPSSAHTPPDLRPRDPAFHYKKHQTFEGSCSYDSRKRAIAFRMCRPLALRLKPAMWGRQSCRQDWLMPRGSESSPSIRGESEWDRSTRFWRGACAWSRWI